MGIWDKLFGEFIDIIEWTDSSVDTMVYRFQRYGNEIKFGAKLTVRESQVAVFISEGEIADILNPGMYELETKNLPILSTLQHWDHGFESPFKAEVYFFNTRQFVDLKWGTRNPIMMRDKEFGMVRLRTFGTYSIRIKDPAKFIREIVGTDGHFTVDEISNQLRNLIITRYTNLLGSADIPVLDLAGNQEQLGELLTQRIAPEFIDYGLELTKILVENISLPPAVEEALDKRTSMGMIGDLNKYIQFGAAESMQTGASSGAGSAIEMGLGFAMANKMALDMAQPQKDSIATTSAALPLSPPPLPDTNWHVAIDRKTMGPYDLDTLQQLANSRQITPGTLAWIDGMKNWASIEKIEALNGLFDDETNTPPAFPESIKSEDQ
ncbi:MAG TPA: SPFH domain-containing protein [Leucothrix sp.]|nr:SPFH domain-containing protein [Leucothrix sp.]HIQ15704.1 SPFH domain-containing protein [Leucothrix sp.]